MLNLGVQLPEWEIRTLNGGTPPRLASFANKPVLLLLYSIGCPGCKARALPFARDLQRNWPYGQVIGVHTRFEGPEYSDRQIEEIKEVYQVHFPVFVDEGHATFDLFEAEGTPHWLLAGRDGRLLKSMFGSMPNTLQRLDLSVQELDLH